MFGVLALCAVVVFLSAPLLFGLVAVSKGMSLSETINALVGQYTAPRQNLLVLSILSLFPVGVLALLMLAVKKLDRCGRPLPLIALTGSVPVVVLTLWINLEFWPIFLPSLNYPGFPHGLEFVIGPLIYAPGAAILAVLLAFFVTRKIRPD